MRLIYFSLVIMANILSPLHAMDQIEKRNILLCGDSVATTKAAEKIAAAIGGIYEQVECSNLAPPVSVYQSEKEVGQAVVNFKKSLRDFSGKIESDNKGILFLQNLDAIACLTGGNVGRAYLWMNAITHQLLEFVDEQSSEKNVIVIAGISNKGVLDKAILNRFSLQVLSATKE